MNKDDESRHTKPILLSVFVNILLALAKGVAGFFGNSNAMLADAAESFSDVMTSAIVWLGIKTAIKEPDEDHPYGHGKAEAIASAAVVIFLLCTSIVIASRGIERLTRPAIVPQTFTLFILIAVIALKEISYRYLSNKANSVRSNALLAEAMHSRTDAVTSLIAFIGIGLSILGGKKFAAADSIASLVASAVIGFNAILIFKPAINELMDAAPPEELKQQVKKIPLKVNGVIEVEKCLLRKMGTHYWIDMHVVVDGNLSVHDGHYIAHKVKDTLKTEMPFITEVNVHIEPDKIKPD